MTTSFTNTFGGSAVSPADVAYASYSFGSNLTLFWPQFANGQTNVAARFMNLTASVASLNVSMPDATLNSVGYDAIIFNAGMQDFNVVTFGGTAIVTIAPGQTYYLMLNGNATQNGTWQTVQFGVGTGSANAAALAGAGLLAISGLLNVNLAGNTVTNSFSLTAAARSLLYVWTGGSGTITLPTASSVGNGFFFMLANNGSGSVTVAASGGNTIDGAATSVFAQTQSGFVMSNGTAWITVGKGIQNTFAVTLLNLNVAGSADVTETSAQAQNIIQQYTGLLTGNINVIVPTTVQLYFANNMTTGAFTLTVKTASGTGILIPQGQQVILYCDGTNVVNAYTASISGTFAISAGSAVSPSLSVQGSPGTGLFSPLVNQISVTAGSNETARFSSAPSSVNYLQFAATPTATPPTISAAGTDANVGIRLVPKGTGSVTFPKLDGTIIGSVTPASITGTTVTAASFVGPLTGNVTGNASGTSFNVTGTVAIAHGGTGQTTQQLAIDALLPSQGGNSGKVLGTNGTTSLWTTVSGGGGTVTSISTNNGISGGPITTTGIISLANQSSLTVLSNITGGATAPTGNTVSAVLDATVGSSQGTLAYRNASGWVPLAAGTTGQVLQTGGAAGNPSWTTALVNGTTGATQAPGDNTTKIATTAFVNGTALNITNGSVGTTQAPGDNTTKVATTAFVTAAVNAVALPAPFAVGSYVMAKSGGSQSPGNTVAGSSLTVMSGEASGSAWITTADVLTGTWQAMSTAFDNQSVILWLRIS